MMRRAAAPEDEGDEEDEDEEGEEIGGETSGSGTGSDSDLPPASRSDESDASAGGRGGAGWPRPAGSGRTGEFLPESDEDGAPRPPARPSSSFPPAGSPRRRPGWDDPLPSDGPPSAAGSSAGSDQDFLSGSDGDGGSLSSGTSGRSRSRGGSLVHGRYIKGKIIGQGSFGKVYKSYDSQTGRVVAIKTVNLDAANAPQFSGAGGSGAYADPTAAGGTHPKQTQNNFRTAMDAFRVETVNDFKDLQKEIQVLAQCRSPFVVRYFTSLVIGHELWIVMEFLTASVKDILRYNRQILLTGRHAEFGANLATSIVGGGFYGPSANSQLYLPLSLILHDVVSALVYLHEIFLTHRDIKAANVMLGEDGSVKLTDFGVAGQMSFSSTANIVNKMNSVVGTPFWMAPEVIQQKGYDTSADIWSIGITAIEMAVGSPPHAEMHPMKALMLIPQSSPPRLEDYEAAEEPRGAEQSPSSPSPSSSGHHHHHPAFGDSLKDFVATCLQRDPAARPTARELLAHRLLTQKRHHRRARQQLVAIVREFEAHRERTTAGRRRSPGAAAARERPDGAASPGEGAAPRPRSVRKARGGECTNGRAADAVSPAPGWREAPSSSGTPNPVAAAAAAAAAQSEAAASPAAAGGPIEEDDWHDPGPREHRSAQGYDSDGSMNTMIIRDLDSPSNSNVDESRNADGRSPAKGRRGSFLPVDVIRRFFNVNYDLKPKPSYTNVMETLASSAKPARARHTRSAPATPIDIMSGSEGDEGEGGGDARPAGLAKTTGAKAGHVAAADDGARQLHAKRSLNFSGGGGPAAGAENPGAVRDGDGGADTGGPADADAAAEEEEEEEEEERAEGGEEAPPEAAADGGDPGATASDGGRSPPQSGRVKRRASSLPVPALVPMTMTLLILIADTLVALATRATLVAGAYLWKSSRGAVLGVAGAVRAVCVPMITIGMEATALLLDIAQSLWIHSLLLALWALRIYLRCLLAVTVVLCRIVSRAAVSLLATWLATAHVVAVGYDKLVAEFLGYVYEISRPGKPT